jgi:ABC-2 type transport system permease protein
MKSWFVRAVSFLIKEIHEVRRQPLLLLSLIGGPFLVLALFGATFRSTKPLLTTVLVWPETGLPGIERRHVEEAVRWNFELVGVVDDQREALRMLERGEVDVVQIIPANIQEQIQEGRQANIQVYSYTIDPTAEAWIRSMMLGQVNFINRQMLLDRTGQAQQQAITVQIELDNAKGILAQIELNLTEERQRDVERALNTLRGVLRLFLTFLHIPGDEQGTLVPYTQELRGQITRFMKELDKLDAFIESGQVREQLEQMQVIQDQIDNLQGTIGIFVRLPPEVIVSPVHVDYSNQRGQAYSLMVYYTPRVLTLLIQHLAITLGALSLVRERLIGAFEMFRIAPLSIAQILLGKTAAYSLYVLVMTVTLSLLLRALNVPLLGEPLLMIALVLMLTLASVGIGMLISAISSSDSQAIQLTMLFLLLSVFFTGFFLPLEGFTSLAQPISTILPMTHGLEGLQLLMLIGRSPPASVWISLGAITAVTYGLTLLLVPYLNRRMMG